MSQTPEPSLYVRVRDGAGNEFVCPIEALKDIREVPDEILDRCVDDATVGRYAGNITVGKPPA